MNAAAPAANIAAASADAPMRRPKLTSEPLLAKAHPEARADPAKLRRESRWPAEEHVHLVVRMRRCHVVEHRVPIGRSQVGMSVEARDEIAATRRVHHFARELRAESGRARAASIHAHGDDEDAVFA